MRCAPFLLLVLLLLVSPLYAGEEDLAPKPAAHVRPPVFADLSFEAATKQAAEDGKFLILDAMTTWCSPCRHMDETTWRDETLVAWIEKHAIAVQVDMEARADIKTKYAVTGFPTIVVFESGEEVERVMGGRDAAFMLDWMRVLETGRTRKQAAQQAYDAFRKRDAASVTNPERMAMLMKLADVRLGDAATSECVTLWDQALSAPPALAPRDQSRLLGVTAGLARSHEGSRAAVRKIRDRLAPGEPQEDLHRWFTLCQVLDEESTVVTWATQAVNTEPGLAKVRTLGGRLFGPLVAAGRWAEAGKSLADPLAFVRFQTRWNDKNRSARMGMPMLRGGGPSTIQGKPLTTEERMHHQSEDLASDCYAALLAAKRLDEATAIAAELLEVRDTPRARTALVVKAMRAGQFDTRAQTHRRWLDEAVR